MLNAAFIYAVSLPIYIALLIILIKKKGPSIVFSSLFYFYVVVVIGVTLFPLPIQKSLIESRMEMNSDQNNFIPFTFLPDALAPFTYNPAHVPPSYFDYRLSIALRQVGGNILLGIPFGFLAPLVWKKQNSFWKVLLAGFCFSLAIEASQFLISSILGYTYRITDIDDIILNCIGCMLGYGLVRILQFVKIPLNFKKA